MTIKQNNQNTIIKDNNIQSVVIGKNTEKPKNCYICQSTSLFRKIQVGERIFYKCNNCDVLFLAGSTKTVDLNKIYGSEYYFQKDSSNSENFFGYNDYDYYRKYIEEYFEYHLKEIERFNGKGNLLDVGCAFGYMLNVANRRGWKSEGIDISKYAVDYAKNNFNLNVKHGKFEEVHYKQNSFNAIVMNDLIEHIPTPQIYIEKAHNLLKKNGILFISTPNSNSLSFRILGKRWLQIMQEDHLYLFNPNSIRFLLEKSGFKILKIKTSFKVADINVIVGRLGYYSKNLKKIAGKITDLLNLGKIKFKVRVGEIYVVSQKK